MTRAGGCVILSVGVEPPICTVATTEAQDVHPHFHGGATAFVQTVVFAVIGINLWRLGAARLAANPRTEAVGRALGSLVTWGGR